MSKKTEAILDKISNPLNTIIVSRRGNGRSFATALDAVATELSVDPPASKQEVEAFLRLHIKRCRVNLANAKDRGDNTAKANLERKLAVYEYLMQMSTSAVNAEARAMRECPNCRVTSVDIFGLCHCCGQNW